MTCYLDKLTVLVNTNGPDRGDTCAKELKEAYCFIKALESNMPKTRQAQKGNILQNQFKNSKKVYLYLI
jgi:hypothetical protein